MPIPINRFTTYVNEILLYAIEYSIDNADRSWNVEILRSSYLWKYISFLVGILNKIFFNRDVFQLLIFFHKRWLSREEIIVIIFTKLLGLIYRFVTVIKIE